MKTTSGIIRNWFDITESTLETEAKQAGLFDHPTMTGTAREFLIKRALKTVLPPIVHIGSGKIIDCKNNSSRQVDIIIYDSRFPIFEIEPGIGTYLIEGVIATIEVKSNLTKKGLINALENSLSVLKLHIGVKKKPTNEDTKRLVFSLMPANYVFAYKSSISQKRLRDIVDDWYEYKHKPAFFNGQCAALPRIILAGKKIGMLDDGFVNIDPGNDVLDNWRKLGNSDLKVILGFWKTKYHFGFLMVHLLITISYRYELSHRKRNVEYAIEHYLTTLDYFKTEINKQLAEYSIF